MTGPEGSRHSRTPFRTMTAVGQSWTPASSYPGTTQTSASLTMTSTTGRSSTASTTKSSDEQDMTPEQRKGMPSPLDFVRMKKLMRKKKSSAVQVLVTLFPRIPKVTTVLLEFFIKRENKVSQMRDPLWHFCQEQCVLAAQDCLQKLHRQFITYQDIRDMIENLVCLHELCIKRAPTTARNMGLLVRKLTIIVGELATSLEKISEVQITDWMAVGDSVIIKTDKLIIEEPLHFTEFVPKAKDIEVIKLLGAGGFGAVYKARYKPANLVCTLKMVAADRFNRPKQACIDKVVASVTKCPFLVKYYTCFATKEAYITMMEYVYGIDVMRVVERAMFLPVDHVRIIMAQLILAVEHLHLKGILHRDIKVSNMLIIPGGRVKLIDFDTNKICLGHFTKRVIRGYFRRTCLEFRDCEAAGTIPYMAPEILKRRPYGRACDWWSTGIVFYKLMTGRVPFRGRSRKLLRDRIIGAPLKWPKMAERPASSAAKDMVYLLLKKNPIERLGSKQYRDVKTHAFFDNFSWAKLRTTKELCNVPAIFELMHSPGNDTEGGADEEGNNSNMSPGATSRTKRRKLLHMKDLADMDRSIHRPLFTYASPTFQRIVKMVKEAENPVSVGATFMDATNTFSTELDYQKATDADSTLGLTANTDGLSRRATERLDLILFRKKSFGRFWNFGVNLEPVTGEGGRNFYIVQSVKRGSPAHRSQIVEGDVVVAVNGTDVSELPINAVRKIMDSAGDQLVLTVLSSSPFRIINTRQDMTSILQRCQPQTVSLGVVKAGCRSGASYGFTTTEVRTWDHIQKSFIRLHIIDRVKDVYLLSRFRGLFPGDIITHIENVSVSQMSQAALRQSLANGGPELQMTIAPLSPLRQRRPSSTRLRETFLSNDSVGEPSSVAAITAPIGD
ncbi:microtubule-associated serine/threonine-protein kinase 3-like isoform X2 [Ornithodoros turicata]|uniref:microtubule-associated serine/threonine-protein kinase 3-like isoform X2 n=1 Tax=Ornithodoros turicata TaxID=34597 RepID=UPI003139AFE5